MKSSGPVLIGGVGVRVAAGEDVLVGRGGVFVAVDGADVDVASVVADGADAVVASSGVSVGVGGTVSCVGELLGTWDVAEGGGA